MRCWLSPISKASGFRHQKGGSSGCLSFPSPSALYPMKSWAAWSSGATCFFIKSRKPTFRITFMPRFGRPPCGSAIPGEKHPGNVQGSRAPLRGHACLRHVSRRRFSGANRFCRESARNHRVRGFFGGDAARVPGSAGGAARNVPAIQSRSGFEPADRHSFGARVF